MEQPAFRGFVYAGAAQAPAGRTTKDDRHPWPVGHGLTSREREVLRLLCLRFSNGEIAEHLCIGIRTAETHVANIIDKLQVANRREAAFAALALGLLN
jgi:DNA-binding NarL/FixJ family response regulator